MVEGAMSALGQNAKYSVRADIFRFALELGHCAKQRALPIWADSVEKVPAAVETKFLRAADAFNAVRRGGPRRLELKLSATFLFA
jgi:hypothetical protein